MEEGVQAWVQYFSNGGQRVQSTAKVAGDVAPGGGIEGGKVDVDTQSEATVGSILLKAFGPGGQAGVALLGNVLSSRVPNLSLEVHRRPMARVAVGDGQVGASNVAGMAGRADVCNHVEGKGEVNEVVCHGRRWSD
ncbi:hypothetical protein PIB30_012243 [Stylosanthes scabra]|uniref:Uncharacterized protein n=1 Tax=Stylosanthes scabra TaxID=79078 RepID=A0ABU6V598_9FABA|nr:hypothetical protein [Stylosanthes scabra]